MRLQGRWIGGPLQQFLQKPKCFEPLCDCTTTHIQKELELSPAIKKKQTPLINQQSSLSFNSNSQKRLQMRFFSPSAHSSSRFEKMVLDTHTLGS